MTKDEMENKYSAFITEIFEILGLGKPIDILKLCATTDLFFQPLEKRIAELEKENAELKKRNAELAGQKASLERWFGEAKEIIRDLLSLKSTASSAEDVRKRFSVREKAERFLKEGEE